MQAFGNDPACKDAVMENLRRLEAAGAWTYRPVFWDADSQSGSVVGSLLRGDDLNQWQDQMGLPKWLALLIDGVWSGAPSRKEGVTAAIAIIQGVETGIDVTRVGSRFVMCLLNEAIEKVSGFGPRGDMGKLAADIAQLHRRCVEAGDVSAGEWRDVRRAATTVVKDLAPDSVDAALGACVEATAWDPRRSRTVVSDTLYYWLRARVALTLRDYGWTSADDSRIKKLLDALNAQAVASAPDEQTNVFTLLEQHHPEEATRLKARYAYERQQYAAYWRHALQVLMEELK
ncbi:MAG: hypothetical protein WC617_19225 [Rhodanobacter sp.]